MSKPATKLKPKPERPAPPSPQPLHVNKDVAESSDSEDEQIIVRWFLLLYAVERHFSFYYINVCHFDSFSIMNINVTFKIEITVFPLVKQIQQLKRRFK